MLHHTHHTDAVTCVSNVVGHVPLEISKYCYHFIRHGGEIEGKVADIRPRRSPIPLGGLEVKLNLSFTVHNEGPSIHMMRQFLRDSYSWNNTGEQMTVQQDDKEYYNFFNYIICQKFSKKFT